MNARSRSGWIFLLKLMVTIVPAYWVWRNIQLMPGLESDHFRALSERIGFRWIFLGLTALAASHFLGAHQWRILLVTQGVKMSYKNVLRIYWMGLFFNNFMPGNVGGDLKRVVDIKVESGERLGAGLSATVFDRIFGLFFLNALSLAAGLLFFVWDPQQSPVMIPSLGVFCGFCFLFASIFSRRIGLFAERLIRHAFPETIAERFVGLRNRFHLFRRRSLWAQITVYSAIVQIFRVCVHWFCGLAIGVNISVSWYFYYIPLVAVVSALPISIGGFGPRELLAQSLFAQAGVSAMESVLVQLLAYLVNLVVSFFGALEFIFHRRVNNL